MEGNSLVHLFSFTKVYSPVGGRTVQGILRDLDANVHSLDGYTCQGTPSLIDGPQPKASQPNEAIPRGELSELSERCRSCRSPVGAVGAVGGGYDSMNAWSLSDSCRSCRTVGLSDAVGLSDICRTSVGLCCRTVGPGLRKPHQRDWILHGNKRMSETVR